MLGFYFVLSADQQQRLDALRPFLKKFDATYGTFVERLHEKQRLHAELQAKVDQAKKEFEEASKALGPLTPLQNDVEKQAIAIYESSSTSLVNAGLPHGALLPIPYYQNPDRLKKPPQSDATLCTIDFALMYLNGLHQNHPELFQ